MYIAPEANAALGVFSNANDFGLFLTILPRTSLHYKLQRATKAVKTRLENDVFPFVLFYLQFSVNSLIPLAPQFNVVWVLWSVQSKK